MALLIAISRVRPARAHENKARRVRARDEQQAADGREQHDQHGLRRADHFVVQRRQHRGQLEIRVRIVACQRVGDPAGVGACGVDRHTGPKPRDDGQNPILPIFRGRDTRVRRLRAR
jgi:hypothetical protein